MAALRALLESMEQELGLDDLSEAEKSVLYAVELLGEEGGEVPLAQITKHSLVARLSRPTFYRALRQLVNEGVLEASYAKNASFYRIVKEFPQ
jgi:uncharacterized membrane protein